jgi:hypothetical protein
MWTARAGAQVFRRLCSAGLQKSRNGPGQAVKTPRHPGVVIHIEKRFHDAIIPLAVARGKSLRVPAAGGIWQKVARGDCVRKLPPY